MKKRIISCTLSATMLFSTSFVSLQPTALADAYTSVQKLESGQIIFPNDYISFENTSKIIYNTYSSEGLLPKEYVTSNSYDSIKLYEDVFQTNKKDFYGWLVVNDNTTDDSDKRTSLELKHTAVIHDSTKADLTIEFPENGTNTKPIIKLTPKSGYVVDSVASGILYNSETNEITIQNPIFDENDNINLGDTYKKEVPTITLYKGSEQINELKICPTSSNIQFNAKATYESGVEAIEEISWKLNDGLEFISIDNTGIVTVTPYFTGDVFTVTASLGDSSASATIHLEHSYGDWTETLAPTASSEGISTRTCSVCSAPDTKPIEKIKDETFPTGKITINGTDNWAALVSNVDYNSYGYNSANIEITAEDNVEVKDVSYYLSSTALTLEQLKSLTTWTSGKNLTLTTNGKYVVYAKITDSSENVSYISTNGFVIDNISPVIVGIENGQTYTDTKTFTITEENLKSVKINNIDAQSVNGIYTLPLASNPIYTVYVSDIAGNSKIYTVSILKNTYADQNKISGITVDGTYRKGSSISFTAQGYNMNLSQPAEGSVRYLPISYKVLSPYDFTSSTYRQSISTSNLSVGKHTLTVTFNHQVYSASEGWKNTGLTDTKSVDFNIQKRQEIETRTFRSSFFTIKFETNGGSKLANVMVNNMKYLKEPVSPTKTGYKFDGWYTDKELTNKYDFSQRVKKNMTLYAKWIKSSSSSSDKVFTVVSKDDKYFDDIAYVYASGLMNGTGEESFSPDMPTTRAMIVTILYRLEGEPATNKSNFTDVPSDSYYAKAVSWAQENDIVKGTTSTTFAPNNEITREQLMTILYRFAEYKDYELSSRISLINYKDAEIISKYAYDAFSWAMATKVASERTEKYLKPRSSATRAEVAAAFQNFIEGNEQ